MAKAQITSWIVEISSSTCRMLKCFKIHTFPARWLRVTTAAGVLVIFSAGLAANVQVLSSTARKRKVLSPITAFNSQVLLQQLFKVRHKSDFKTNEVLVQFNFSFLQGITKLKIDARPGLVQANNSPWILPALETKVTVPQPIFDSQEFSVEVRDKQACRS